MNLLSPFELWEFMSLAAVQAAVIMGLALLFGAAFPSQSAIRSCIYTTAVCCTLAGPLLLVGTSIADIAFRLPLTTDQSSSPFIEKHVNGGGDRSRGATQIRRDEGSRLVHSPVAPMFRRDNSVPMTSVLIGLWGLGSLTSGIGIAISLTRIRKVLQAVEPVNRSDFAEEIAQAAANLGIKDFPRIGTTPILSSPVALGLPWRPIILLPGSCLQTTSRDQLVQILTHEGAHVLRHDPVVRLLQRISLAIWWWNPLVYLLSQQLNQAREEVCDNAVIAFTAANVYSSTLLGVGRLISQKNRLVGCAPLIGSRWTLERRIKGLLNPERNMMVHVKKPMLAFVMIALGSLTVVTSVTRLEAQQTQVADTKSKEWKKKQFRHIVAAYQNLLHARFHELARMVGGRLEEHADRLDDSDFVAVVMDRAKQRIVPQDSPDHHVAAACHHLRLASMGDFADLIAEKAASSLRVSSGNVGDRHSDSRQQNLGAAAEYLAAARRHLKLAGLEEAAVEIGRLAHRLSKDHLNDEDFLHELNPDRFENQVDRGNPFQDDVRGALRNINQALEQLRNDVDKLQDLSSESSQ